MRSGTAAAGLRDINCQASRVCTADMIGPLGILRLTDSYIVRVYGQNDESLRLAGIEAVSALAATNLNRI